MAGSDARWLAKRALPAHLEKWVHLLLGAHLIAQDAISTLVKV